jgi:hypothetical protein
MIRSKICQNSSGHMCSRKDVDDWVYCPCCGSMLTVRRCEECSEEMDTDWLYCVKCGHGDSKRIQAKMMKKMDEK